MSAPIRQTTYRPGKPLLIWDGKCGFCHYWAIRWERMTGDAVEYRPHTQMLEHIPDIPAKEFKQSVKFIEPDGRVYHAAEAAYKSLSYAGRWKVLYRMYRGSRLFRWMSESIYRYVARHRPFLFDVTRILFGKNPARPRPYWLMYLAGVLVVVIFLVSVMW